ncbi:MAG: adenosylcobinamide-GDP ribazoletransferase [Cyanobacteria bacterium P01_A01_bin.70]
MSDFSPPPTPPDPPRWQRWGAQLIGAVTFYTAIPIPQHWPMQFEGIARYAPLVGLGIGALLAGADTLLAAIALPMATRCGLLVALWLLITGGLHLDGAMDTADGLAVPDRNRRLAVMADSRSGAFGVMTAIVLLGLKGVCLFDLEAMRWFALLAATGWSRWGQVVAIARYPYLKRDGKGAFHKVHAQPKTDWLVGLTALLGLTGVTGWLYPEQGPWLVGTVLGGETIALLTGAWFSHQLRGQTGDTYGAIVEWTEALLLCLMVGLQGLL